MTTATTEETHVYSLNDLEHAVVAGCLAETEILEYVAARYATRLTARLRSLFVAAEAYFSTTRGLLTRDALAQILANSEPDIDKHQDYLSLYDALTSPPYSDYEAHHRRWFLHQYDIEWKRDQTGNILAGAAEAMRTGTEVYGTRVTGAEAAWQYIQTRRLDYESNTGGQGISEAELTSQIDAAKQDYRLATEGKGLGAPLCLPEVNNELNTLRPGDMYFVTAYAGEGKSFMMMNDAHHSWVQGKNVSYGSGEMNIRKHRNRFIACHAKFLFDTGKQPMPLETKKIDQGKLTTEEHEVFLSVLEDIKGNANYGKFYLFKFPRNSTPTVVFNRFAMYDQIVPLDLGVLDYLGLMSSEQRRVSRREELDDLIRHTKQLAMAFRNDDGLALEVGYQTNRVSFERARQDGYYTLSCFAESSEAEKTADSALWLLSLPQNPDQLKAGFVKNRDGETGEPFFVARNYRYAQIASMMSSRGQDPVPGPGVSDSKASILDI